MNDSDNPANALDDFRRAYFACEHSALRNKRISMKESLERLAASCGEEEKPDVYGTGTLIEDFQDEIAALLGKEAALFMPSGTMAQLIALRIWAERSGKNTVALHPTSHLVLHEQNAYQHLHGLGSVSFGAANAVPGPEDLKAAARDELAAVLYELPMREIGGQLPDWDDLLQMSEFCRERGIRFHMDGARLWQVPAAYERNLGDISALFDSVYLSFYKDLGGISGAVLAGDRDFIESARVWLRRGGGNLYALYPYVLSAREGLRRHLPDMPRRREQAIWYAAKINELDGIETWPKAPRTNMFRLRINIEPELYYSRAAAWMERHRTALLPGPYEEGEGYSLGELTIGDAFGEKTRDEWAELLLDFWNELSRP